MREGRPHSNAGREAPEGSARSDDELMVAARGGDLDAFDALVRRHQDRALAVAGKYLEAPGLAQDVAQNTFVEVYRGLDRYQARGRFSAYLYRVLVNQCRMACRARGYEERARQVARTEPGRPGPGPEAVAMRRQRRATVDLAVGQLSEKLRAVVLLRFAGDLSYQEIADALHVPLGTVKRRLFDGVRQLRALVRQEET